MEISLILIMRFTTTIIDEMGERPGLAVVIVASILTAAVGSWVGFAFSVPAVGYVVFALWLGASGTLLVVASTSNVARLEMRVEAMTEWAREFSTSRAEHARALEILSIQLREGVERDIRWRRARALLNLAEADPSRSPSSALRHAIESDPSFEPPDAEFALKAAQAVELIERQAKFGEAEVEDLAQAISMMQSGRAWMRPYVLEFLVHPRTAGALGIGLVEQILRRLGGI